MIGVRAEFDLNSLSRYMEEQVAAYKQFVLDAYRDAGRDFVQTAKLKTKQQGSFGNITFNLRSSIGFLLLDDGREVAIEFETVGNGDEGTRKGMSYARELAANYPEGIVLLCVAGMHYAAAVESKGFDVITGSSLYFEQELLELLSE